MYNKLIFGVFLSFFFTSLSLLQASEESKINSDEQNRMHSECVQKRGDGIDELYQWEDGTSTGWLDCFTLKDVGGYSAILEDKNGVYFSEKTAGIQPVYRISTLSGEKVDIIKMQIHTKRKQNILLEDDVGILTIGDRSYLQAYPYFEINRNYRIVFVTKNKKKTIYMSDGLGYIIWRDSSFLYPTEEIFIRGTFQKK